jgi:hypothetical protein
MVNLLNDVGHEGVHSRGHTLTHALGIFCAGQQISPVNADQLGQYDDHEQTGEPDEENGPIGRGLIRTRMVLVEVFGVLHGSDSVIRWIEKSALNQNQGRHAQTRMWATTATAVKPTKACIQ